MQGSKREQQLQEFLGVNKHKSKQQMFANDEVNPELDPTAAGMQAGELEQDDGSSDATEQNLEEMSDMEYLRSRMGKLESGMFCPGQSIVHTSAVYHNESGSY